MPFADYVLTAALGGAFALGLLFIVMRREAQVNIQSGMNAEGLMQQHSGMGFGKATNGGLGRRRRREQPADVVRPAVVDGGHHRRRDPGAVLRHWRAGVHALCAIPVGGSRHRRT